MIRIKEVLTDKDLCSFIRFPRILYKNNPYYVPSLEKEDLETLKHHPAKEFCDIRMWLAYKNNKIVGRIAGIINHKSNNLKNQQRIRFGWLDFEDDINILIPLIQAVETWGREMHMKEISGPSRFSNMEKQGMLIEGFDATPPIASEYNLPYYPQYIENLGYEKEVDYFQYRVKIGEISDKMIRLKDFISDRYNVKIKEFKRKKDMKVYGKQLFLAMNKSYRNIYNFIPLTEKEINFIIQSNFYFLDKDLINILVDKNDQLVGFSLCIPSLSKAFQKAKGKLFPFGWYHILQSIRKNDEVDLYLTGVIPTYSKTGIHLLYHHNLHQVLLKKGYVYGNVTQQLENNTAHNIWEEYDSKLSFKRRCYVKNL